MTDETVLPEPKLFWYPNSGRLVVEVDDGPPITLHQESKDAKSKEPVIAQNELEYVKRAKIMGHFYSILKDAGMSSSEATSITSEQFIRGVFSL